MSYPDSWLPVPLSTPALYVLLALHRDELHVYALRSTILNDSLGSVRISYGRLYELVQRLHDEELVEQIGPSPAGKSGKPRMKYRCSEEGELRLREEFERLNHLIRIGETAGLLEAGVPVEVKRLLLMSRQED